MFDLQTIPATCPGCGSECEAVRFNGAVKFGCDHCAKQERIKQREEWRRNDCVARWEAIVESMPEYRQKIRRELLAPFLLPALELDGTAGAGFAGETGGGKTRVALLLLLRAAKRGLWPFFVNGADIQQAAEDCEVRNPEVSGPARHLLNAARNAGALVLDDVAKGEFTSRGNKALYRLLEDRYKAAKVTFWTMNCNSAWLVRKLGPDYGKPVARRLANLAGCNGKGTGRIFTATNETDGN